MDWKDEVCEEFQNLDEQQKKEFLAVLVLSFLLSGKEEDVREVLDECLARDGGRTVDSSDSGQLARTDCEGVGRDKQIHAVVGSGSSRDGDGGEGSPVPGKDESV